jgi:2,3-dihydroxyphenylpropionate 1,2-dioxygenase
VFGGALSHSPLMNYAAPPDQQPAIDRFRAGVSELRRRLHAFKPDVVILFAPDHFRAAFYDNMPAFCLAVGDVQGWGDWSTPTGPFRIDRQLARYLVRSLLERSFDPAQSYDFKVDHGFSQAIELLSLEETPIVPVFINAAAPPLPAPGRCYDLGVAIHAAVSDYPHNIRVAVIGSGGLSHAPPSVSVDSDRADDALRVDRLIRGRRHVEASEAERERSLIASVARYEDRINPEWDRTFLTQLSSGRAQQYAATLTEAAIETAGGNGGQEIRAWLAAAGAAPMPFETLAYEPVPFLITGMGVGSIPCTTTR